MSEQVLQDLYNKLNKVKKNITEIYNNDVKIRDESLTIVNITKSLIPSIHKVCYENGIEILGVGAHKDISGRFVSYIDCKFILKNTDYNASKLAIIFAQNVSHKNLHEIYLPRNLKDGDKFRIILECNFMEALG